MTTRTIGQLLSRPEQTSLHDRLGRLPISADARPSYHWPSLKTQVRRVHTTLLKGRVKTCPTGGDMRRGRRFRQPACREPPRPPLHRHPAGASELLWLPELVSFYTAVSIQPFYLDLPVNLHFLGHSTILICLLILVSTGCVRRRLSVRTQPAGAAVYVDKQYIGTSPPQPRPPITALGRSRWSAMATAPKKCCGASIRPGTSGHRWISWPRRCGRAGSRRARGGYCHGTSAGHGQRGVAEPRQ